MSCKSSIEKVETLMNIMGCSGVKELEQRIEEDMSGSTKQKMMELISHYKQSVDSVSPSNGEYNVHDDYSFPENAHLKPLKDMKKGDKIYISKNLRGFSYTYECKFESTSRGIVHARIVKPNHDWERVDVDTPITARVNKCFLLGKRQYGEMIVPSANFWFKDVDNKPG